MTTWCRDCRCQGRGNNDHVTCAMFGCAWQVCQRRAYGEQFYHSLSSQTLVVHKTIIVDSGLSRLSFSLFWSLLSSPMTSSSSSSPEIQPAPTADAHERFTYKHATHDEVLEDLSRFYFSALSAPYLTCCSRFLLNLPDEELSSLERICFQVEQA